MTQEQLAEKANMDVSMLARIERGSRGDIRMRTLERIVSGLDVSYQEFFTFPEDGDETTKLASSIALIKDPEVIRALHKIVNTLIQKDNKWWPCVNDWSWIYLIQHLFLYSQKAILNSYSCFQRIQSSLIKKAASFVQMHATGDFLGSGILNSVRLIGTGLKRKVANLLEAYDSSK